MTTNPPIILVIDDGGHPPNDPRSPLEPYHRLLRLARQFDITIPIAVTASYIDTQERSGEQAQPTAFSTDLVALLAENKAIMPTWNHGLTHRHKNQPTEFLLLNPEQSVPEKTQREHLQLSQLILSEAKLATQTLVPPGHAWEPGVTDRLAADCGFTAMAVREFEKTPARRWLMNPAQRYLKTWQASEHLTTLWRLGVGIHYNQETFTLFDLRKAKAYITGSLPGRLLVHRCLSAPRRPHHFFAHIQNFQNPDCEAFWSRIIEFILKGKCTTTLSCNVG